MSFPNQPSSSVADRIQPYALFTQQFALPPGKLCLLHGDESVFPLTHMIASFALRRGMQIAVADGGNWFNVHALIHAARTAGANPDRLLDSIHVSRSFTCYQMEQTITHLLPSFLQSLNARTAVILGLLDTLYDEQAPVREANHILKRMLAALHELKERGISVLITHLDRTVMPEQRNRFSATLARAMDHVYRLEPGPHSNPLLVRESPSAFLHSPGRTSALDHFLPPGEHHGPHRTDVHQYHRQRAGKLDQVPPRSSPRRSGTLR